MATGRNSPPATRTARGAELEYAISKAVEFFLQNQLSHGEFRICVSSDRKLGGAVIDSAPFATAAFLYGTRFLDHPQVSGMRRKAIEFLSSEMEGPGVWRYWSSHSPRHLGLVPDLDDTAFVSFALRKHHLHIAFGSNLQLILDNRDEGGRFYTWLRERGRKNDVDSVVNANVVLYLGEREETRAAIAYLNHIVLTNQETGSYWYYLDDLALYYALSRAYYHGVAGLRRARDAILEKIIARQGADGSFGDDLNTAWAVCALLNYAHLDDALLDPAIAHLLRRQLENGAWSKAAAWTGPEPPTPHSVWWGSEEFTTTLVVEALARSGASLRSGNRNSEHE